MIVGFTIFTGVTVYLFYYNNNNDDDDKNKNLMNVIIKNGHSKTKKYQKSNLLFLQ